MQQYLSFFILCYFEIFSRAMEAEDPENRLQTTGTQNTYLKGLMGDSRPVTFGINCVSSYSRVEYVVLHSRRHSRERRKLARNFRHFSRSNLSPVCRNPSFPSPFTLAPVSSTPQTSKPRADQREN